MTAYILAVALHLVIQFAEAFVAKSYWDWFLAASLGFQGHPLIQWFALNMIISIFCRHFASTKDTRTDIERVKDFAQFCLAPFVFWLLGYLVYRFH